MKEERGVYTRVTWDVKQPCIAIRSDTAGLIPLGRPGPFLCLTRRYFLLKFLAEGKTKAQKQKKESRKAGKTVCSAF